MFFVNYATVIDPLLKGLRAYAIAFSGVKAEDNVLDVCCGTGDQVYHCAEAGIGAVGIDLDPDMLKLAKKDRRKNVLGNASFYLADARNLPFADESFDYAFISFALHEKERVARDEIIAEMKRVVRHGGVLVFIDFQTPLPRNLMAYFVRVIEFLAGKNHNRYFQDYIEHGGLGQILNKNQLAPEKIAYLYNELITIVTAKNP